MEHLFIINPAAGGGKPLKFVPRIKDIFEAKGEACHIEMTRYPGHATQLAREYTTKGKYRVYSVGGDGTLNEIINGMAGSASSLAVIPSGSGNDFIKSICPDYRADDILERTVEGREKPVDLACVNGRYFLNIASVGFDAEVVRNTNKRKKIYGYGSFAYIAGVFETLLKYKSHPVILSVDGVRQMETRALLIAIANGKYYGGGMKPVPGAVVDDGLLDVCLIEAKPRPEILRFFPKFIKGQHPGIQGVHFFQGRRIEILGENELPMNIDGESLQTREAVFTIIPEGIYVVIPQ